uniref:Receptor activity-modifying protein 1 n=1 Tax=Oncorhynchus kisutch TaxID=8019 RepID=A0A8C7K743_ONCKI
TSTKPAVSYRTSCEWICGSPIKALMGLAIVTRPYEELTNCTYSVAHKMHCFWPNQQIDELFIRLHRDYFHDCALTGRLLRDPPIRILGPFIGLPVLVTLLMTALVVWSGKCCQGIV